MQYRQLRKMLDNFGIGPGVPPIPLRRMQLLMRTTASWYGPYWAKYILDLFMPAGEVIEKGYEDSRSHYLFVPMSWTEVQEVW